MTSIDTYAQALEPYRFTPTQARFVVTAALHGGYFLRRQYMMFAGVRYGATVRHFPDRLVARGVAVRERGRRDRGYLYHLHARRLYRALGQEDNRNRRPASFAAIGRKLMLLDFVLAQSDITWAATEVDKVALATTILGASTAVLPQHTYRADGTASAATVRYFPHKLPLGVAGEPPVLHLVALALDTSGDGVRRVLLDHVGLLGTGAAWVLHVVAPAGSTVALGAARNAVEPFFAPIPTVRDAEHARFLALQHALDRNDLAAVSVADLQWYRHARATYGLSDARPSASGAPASRGGALTEADRAALRRGTLRTHTLPWQYDQCGDLAGVC